MELACHVRYTSLAIDAFAARGGTAIDDARRGEILLGCQANDLCELTEESKLVFHWVEPSWILRLFRSDTSALYQSHMGNLASLHCMSKNPGEPAPNTLIDVTAWLHLLQDIALGRFDDPDLPLRDLPPQQRVGYLFEGTGIRLRDLVDTGDRDKIRHRALGMMLHVMEDSCTPSHCDRDATLPGAPIRQFFLYSAQHPMKHKKGDSRLNVDQSILVDGLRRCLEDIVAGRDHDLAPFFRLAPTTRESGAGPWVRTGWLDR